MLRVLVLDGDEAYRKALCAHLGGAGIEAQGIARGAAFGDCLRRGRFDVVLCNVELAHESGFSVAARLRRVSEAGLILLADAEKREDRVLALSLGADHYRLKSGDFGELEMLCRRLQQGLRHSAPEPAGVWISTPPAGR
ncbi:MAG: response regulator transcription factor [Panacagrimonas sp.]